MRWMVLVGALALAGCGPSAEEVAAKKAADQKASAQKAAKAKIDRTVAGEKAAVVKNMLDPEAARFRNLKLQHKGFLCGEVNGKNGFGAYTGYQKFHSIWKMVTFRKTGAEIEARALEAGVTEPMGVTDSFDQMYNDCQAKGVAVQ